MTFERIFEMPRKWTFQMPKTRKWVEARLEGQTLNLFGGVVRLTHNYELAHIIHNDINPANLNEGDLERDAFDLGLWRDYEGCFGTVVFDPPYSAHQAVVSYNMGPRKQRVSHARDVVEYVLRPGGRVISLGWNSTGMSGGRGFEKEGLLLVNHGGSHNDTIVLCERRVE